MESVKVDRWIMRYPDGSSLSVYASWLMLAKRDSAPAGTVIDYRPVIRHSDGSKSYPLGH